MIASSCLSRDLTDCNKGHQASRAQLHTARPPPQQYQRCGQLFGAHSHQQLMRHRFHRSRVSFTAFLWDKIFSRQDFKSMITGPASTSIAPQGSNLAPFRTASAAVTAVFSMLIPVSEKKVLCVNEGRRTKSCTHATAPFTFSWSIATPSSDTVKTGCSSVGPFTTSAVNWKI